MGDDAMSDSRHVEAVSHLLGVTDGGVTQHYTQVTLRGTYTQKELEEMLDEASRKGAAG